MNRQANQASAVTGDSISPLSLLKGIVISYIITIPTFVIFSLIMTYTDFPEKLISPSVVITTIISILAAASFVTRKTSNKGWLNGSIVGLVYMAVLYIISSIVFNNFAIDRYVISMTLIGVLTGAIGGILGINLKKSSHGKARRR